MKEAVSVDDGKSLEHHPKILEGMVRLFFDHPLIGGKMTFTKEDEIKILSYYA